MNECELHTFLNNFGASEKKTFSVSLDKQRGPIFSQKNKQRLSNDLQNLKILKGLKFTALLIKKKVHKYLGK